MRDFEIVFNYGNLISENSKKIQRTINEAFRGMGTIQLGITMTDLCTISKQYTDYLIQTCSFDCFIFTPISFISKDFQKFFDKIFQKLSNTNKYIKFINMYDSSDESQKETTLQIIETFIEKKIGNLIYNMDIAKEPYQNASYLNQIRQDALNSKKDTEIKITNLSNFLQKYDEMIQSKDSYTAEHGRAVCKFSLEIGKSIGLNAKQLEILCIGAALHDIGKYEIDLNILTKNQKLTDSEFTQIKNHTIIGKVILDKISITELSEIENEIIELIVEQHHEKYDGTGYPRKIDGNIIHKYSMIVALADSFHAMLGRSYQKPRSKISIIQNIRECSGSQFHPELAEIFCKLLENNYTKFGLAMYENKYFKYSATQSIKELVEEAKNYC